MTSVPGAEDGVTKSLEWMPAEGPPPGELGQGLVVDLSCAREPATTYR